MPIMWTEEGMCSGSKFDFMNYDRSLARLPLIVNKPTTIVCDLLTMENLFIWGTFVCVTDTTRLRCGGGMGE